MSTAYTGERTTGDGCPRGRRKVRLRRDLPMVDTVTDVTCELALLTGTGAT
jgi:hypothetical protein